MDHERWARRRLFNAIMAGDGNLAREVLEGGCDPNVRNSEGTPAIIEAAKTLVPESGVIDALLDAGADPQVTDEFGLTALDHARRRLIEEGEGRDSISRSKSLDASGNLVLSDEEKAYIEELREAGGERGDEGVEIYMQERRKAALRQFMPRRELKIIIDRLEALGH
ncbi:MAG TPA: hypothetical protein P5081_20900 [Phycisphaerae bacterium]|nr:hypothetical protein [Phycisphaerae bacterium]HRW55340.1 hypothetical protein [Phycisphaerae bacterium]